VRTRIIVAVAVCAALAFGAGAMAAGTPPGKHPPKSHAAKPKLENRALFAVLTGRKEVDADGRRGAGDLNGRGSFTAIVDGDRLCFGITVKNLGSNPVAAHIHGRARPNQNAPIVVALIAPTDPDQDASSDCVPVDPDVARAILKNPHKYYANVHTEDFPDGALRGQLFRRPN
jgi:CHRD domain